MDTDDCSLNLDHSHNLDHATSHLPIKSNTNNNYLPHSRRPQLHDDDTETLTQYQLRREREKTRILEERLNNKEIFINQMKQFQQELTTAFDESQKQIERMRDKIDELQESNMVLRDENSELKQLILKMEKESLLIGQQQQQHSGLVTRRRNSRDHREAGQVQVNSVDRHRIQHISTENSRERLPRMVSAINVSQAHHSQIHRSEPMAAILGNILGFSADEVQRECRRIGKFLQYYLDMVAACSPEARHLVQLRDKLKFSWKWIKGLVRQSAQIREKAIKLDSARGSGDIQRLQSENRQYLHTIRLVMDHFQMPESSTIRELEAFLRGYKR